MSKIFTIEGDTLVKCDYEASGDIIIPDGIRIIGEEAFRYNSKITSIRFPDSIVEIRNSAFDNTGATICNLPSSLTTIGREAFSGCDCRQLESLPNGLTYIGELAFTVLETFDVPYYYECSMDRVHIPSSVQYIGDGAFAGIKQLTVDAQNPYYTVRDNILYTKDMQHLLMAFNSSQLIIVPEGVKHVHSYACVNEIDGFEIYCEIFLPESIEKLGDRLFICYPIVHFTGQDSRKLSFGRCSLEYDNSYETVPAQVFVPQGYGPAYRETMKDIVPESHIVEEISLEQFIIGGWAYWRHGDKVIFFDTQHGYKNLENHTNGTWQLHGRELTIRLQDDSIIKGYVGYNVIYVTSTEQPGVYTYFCVKE